MRRLPTVYLWGLFFFALVLRLVFVYTVNKPIEGQWDPWVYMDLTLYTRDYLCVNWQYCEPVRHTAPEFITMFYSALTNRAGWMPLPMGLLTSFFNPVTGPIIYTFNALIDSVIVVMTAQILLRFKVPHWSGLLAGVLLAIYIPTIVETGVFLQQLYIRFSLVLTLWAYTYAFTGAPRAWVWVSVGTLGAALLGFASLTTRPALWLIVITALLVTALSREHRRLLRAQVIAAAVLVGVLMFFALLRLPESPLEHFAKIAFNLTLGQQSQELSSLQSTVLDCDTLICYDGFQYSQGSILETILRDPSRTASRLTYALWANWVYPGSTHFQEYLLSLDQQKIQHALYMIAGLIGLAWLIGAQQRYTLNLFAVYAVAFAYLCFVYSLISIEPRRMTPMIPFVCIGAAYLIYGVGDVLQRRVMMQRIEAAWLAGTLVLWLLPLAWLLWLVPLGAVPTYAMLTFLRVVALIGAVVITLRWWKRADADYQLWAGGALLALVVGVLAYAQMIHYGWRAWDATLSNTSVTQQVDGFAAAERVCIVLDVPGAEDGRALQIYLNDQLVKPFGEPLQEWTPVFPLNDVYTGYNRFATRPINWRAWYFYPVPLDALTDDPQTIRLEIGETPVTLSGDYYDSDETYYTGPLVSRVESRTYGLMLWNFKDPRIVYPQLLNARYTSTGDNNLGDDLSPSWGRQIGIYRVFLHTDCP